MERYQGGESRIIIRKIILLRQVEVYQMKLFYKTKALVCGMWHMTDYKIDGLIQKMEKYGENKTDPYHPDYGFYSTGHLLKSLCAYEGKNGCYYECFESEEMIEIDVNDTITKEEITKKIFREQLKKILFLERKLRLITGIGITLPVVEVSIFDNKGNLYSCMSGSTWKVSNIEVKDYDNDLKFKLSHNLQLSITDDAIKELEEKNIRFKRALDFYVNSFDSRNIGIRFTLLFSALESLFNIDKDGITKEISNYSSRMLFLSSDEKSSVRNKIYDFYDKRSCYIHGNTADELTADDEAELRSYVREILIIYWDISITYEIYDPQEIKALIDCTDRNSLNLQVQLFIKYLRTPAEKYGELYNQIREELSNENCLILSNKNIK